MTEKQYKYSEIVKELKEHLEFALECVDKGDLPNASLRLLKCDHLFAIPTDEVSFASQEEYDSLSRPTRLTRDGWTD